MNQKKSFRTCVKHLCADQEWELEAVVALSQIFVCFGKHVLGGAAQRVRHRQADRGRGGDPRSLREDDRGERGGDQPARTAGRHRQAPQHKVAQNRCVTKPA